MEKTIITTFGDFNIVSNDKQYAEKLAIARKKKIFLELLIANKDNPTSVDDICFSINNSDFADEMNANTLKTLVSRIRKELSEYGLEDSIKTSRMAYNWQSTENVDLDCEIFENACNIIKELTHLTPEYHSAMKSMIDVYNGYFLENTDAINDILQKRNDYHKLFLENVKKYIGLLTLSNNNNEIIKVCKKVTSIFPDEIFINVELMIALLKAGKTSEAITQFRYISAFDRSVLSEEYKEKIVMFYRQLSKNDKKSKSNLEFICESLSKSSDETGAFICDYSLFKDIFKIYMSNLSRKSLGIYLAVVSIRPKIDEDINIVDEAMERLLETLRSGLRCGDTISRYNSTQYSILLPTIGSNEIGELVMGRIIERYKNNQFDVSYKLTPLKN